jgi:hypothetical protein
MKDTNGSEDWRVLCKFEDISALVGIARNLLYPTTLDHLSAA